MNYIDEMAALIERAIPDAQRPESRAAELYRLYALLAFTRGKSTSASDVHDAWSVWMLSDDPDHSSIVPYAQLLTEVQREDSTFLNAILKAVDSSS